MAYKLVAAVLAAAVAGCAPWSAGPGSTHRIPSIEAIDTLPRASVVHKNAQVAVSVELVQDVPRVSQVQVAVRVEAHNFKNPARVERVHSWSIGPGTTRRTLLIPLDDPRLTWPVDFLDAHTFVARVEVRHEGATVDRALEVFSFRSVRYDPTVRIWTVNGKRVYPQPKEQRADGGFDPDAKVLPGLGR